MSDNFINNSLDFYKGKFTTVVDSNLYSGSSDFLRNAVGGYFEPKNDDNGNLLNPPHFVGMKSIENRNENIYSVDSYSGEIINNNIELLSTTGIAEPIDSDDPAPELNNYLGKTQNTILPYTRFVCHIEGDPTHPQLQNLVVGNKYWKSLFTGEEFDGSLVQPIYSNSTFDQHYTNILLPYEKKEQNTFTAGDSLSNVTDVSYKYSEYNKIYQNSIASFNNEKLAPNFYVLKILEDYENYDDRNITNYYQVQESKNFFNNTHASASVRNLNSILQNMFLKNNSITDKIQSTQTNILFNSSASRKYLKTSNGASTDANLLPYYIKFNIDTEKSGRYGKIIEKHNFSTLLLRNMKEVFLEQAVDKLKFDNVQFVLNTNALQVPSDKKIEKLTTTSAETTLRAIDFTELLLYSHNNIKEENNDFFVVDDTNMSTKSATDTDGVYRALNSRNTLRTINETLSTFCVDENAFKVSEISSLLNLRNQSTKLDESPSTLAEPAANEVIAYRVEKIGGQPLGDSNTQNVIQNFWIFNDSELTNLSLYDIQVKYGFEYTYKIYAYYLVDGVKYETSNLQITRIVGNVRGDNEIAEDITADTGIDSTSVSDSSEQPITGYCVEYYDPATGQPVRDLLDAAPSTDSSLVTNTAYEDTVRIRVSGRTSDTDIPLAPFIANFVVTTQPSLKIVEVPLQTKSISVFDYIPNTVNVIPNFALNNSNKLIFDIMYQNADDIASFPKVLNSTEAAFRDRFLNSNDMDIETILPMSMQTVSPPRFLDVYRINYKPQSVEDFSDNIITTIDNRIDFQNYAYKNFIFTDIVKSNTKYYYLFRIRNDLGISGHNSVILEAELISDGGYKYASYETISEADMVVDKYKNISETIKKIIQLVPNFKQLEFEDSAVDYSKTALEEYNKLMIGTADDAIWNKTFKLRLTSKKTGKKIDLNITYNDPNIKLVE